MSNIFANDNQFIFSWKIVNFSLCAQPNGEEIRSPAFVIDNFDESSWYLSLYPRGFQKNTNDEYLSCFLNRGKEKGKTKNFSVEVKMEILAASGFPIVSKNLSGEIVKYPQNRLGWDDFISRNQLFQFQKSYLPDDVLSLNCTIVNRNHSKKLSAPGQSVCTTIAVDKFSFKWEIKFPKCSEVKKVSLSHLAQAKLKVYAIDDNINISILINEIKNRSSQNEKFNYLKCKVSLLDLYENEYFVKETICLFDTRKSVNEFEVPTPIQQSYLNSEQETFLKDDKISLKCDLSLSNGNISSKSEEHKVQILSKTNDSNLNLCNVMKSDLRKLYVEKLYTDVKIHAKKSVFPAHKAILSIRSPVFFKMLENSTDTVVVSDIEENILELLLEFIYTGFVNISGYDIATKLILAAHNYQILSLKENCSTFLKFYLSEDTVCEILTLAQSVKHQDLKTSAIDYMKKHFQNLLFSDKWQHFLYANPKLCSEVLGRISENFEICASENSFNENKKNVDESEKTVDESKRNICEKYSTANIKNSNSFASQGSSSFAPLLKKDSSAKEVENIGTKFALPLPLTSDENMAKPSAFPTSYFNLTVPPSYTITLTMAKNSFALASSDISTSGSQSTKLAETLLSSSPSFSNFKISSQETKSNKNCIENTDSCILDKETLSLLQHDSVSEELSSFASVKQT